jgi:short-subunit dehydrogenase
MLAPNTFTRALESVLARFGRVDILVHCAGISQRGTAVETELRVDRHLMELNYFGPVALTKLVLPTMLARGSGHIVVVSSVMGKLALPARGAYAASKHALHGFFDALRLEVEGRGVTVTIVCPGYVRTNASFNALEGDGTPHNKWDKEIKGGLAPEKCARQIVRAIERRKPEVYVARYEKLGLYLNRFAPSLLKRIIRAKYRKRRS